MKLIGRCKPQSSSAKFEVFFIYIQLPIPSHYQAGMCMFTGNVWSQGYVCPTPKDVDCSNDINTLLSPSLIVGLSTWHIDLTAVRNILILLHISRWLCLCDIHKQLEHHQIPAFSLSLNGVYHHAHIKDLIYQLLKNKQMSQVLAELETCKCLLQIHIKHMEAVSA